ncbi:MAG: CBS domain-containing protein [Acidobacteriota bacterium]
MRVGDAFQPNAMVLDADLTVDEVIVQNLEFTTIPIINGEQQCVGVITEMRLRRNPADQGGKRLIRNIADRCHSIHPDHLLNRAVSRMNQAHVGQLSVIERGEGRRFLGIITMSDIVRAQAEVIDETDLSQAPSLGSARFKCIISRCPR